MPCPGAVARPVDGVLRGNQVACAQPGADTGGGCRAKWLAGWAHGHAARRLAPCGPWCGQHVQCRVQGPAVVGSPRLANVGVGTPRHARCGKGGGRVPMPGRGAP